MTDPVSIKSGDFWVKVVEMLQQNWALIDIEPDSSARVMIGISVRRVFDQFSVSLRLPFGGVVAQYSKFFLRRTYRSNTMNESTINLAHIEEDILPYDVSDQALEAAAGMPEGKAASFTVAFCTGLDTCPR